MRGSTANVLLILKYDGSLIDNIKIYNILICDNVTYTKVMGIPEEWNIERPPTTFV